MKLQMPSRKTPPEANTPVRELWNLSDLTAQWLNDLDILTFEDLFSADLLEVFFTLKSRHKQVTKLMYYALWGATNNCHWNNIPDEEKEKISEAVRLRK
jgi:DNA transformation protein and related proteins